MAAAQRGMRVELFEQARWLGGRAASFVDAVTGDRIDLGQHVAMGCCRQLIDFCRSVGVAGFDRYETFHFIDPEGVRHDWSPVRWLPSPAHRLPGLMRLRFLTFAERWAIVRAMRRLTVAKDMGNDAETADLWLRRHGQSDRAMDRFWSPVLVSALGETVDRASIAAARQVFCDGFMASRDAADLLIPKKPLGEMFDVGSLSHLERLGVVVHLRRRVARVEGCEGRAASIVLGDGSRRAFDFFVVATPWRNVRSLLDDSLAAAVPSLEGMDHIEPGAITTVHLWFDRELKLLPHAVLLERLGQWVFCRGRHVQVVISASHRLVEYGPTMSAPKMSGPTMSGPTMSRPKELCDRVLAELIAIWPVVRDAGLVHDRVITVPAAVFAMRPGVERWRPTQATPIKNLALAGDWTATGWPATMEGAVRSGRLAIEAIGMGGNG